LHRVEETLISGPCWSASDQYTVQAADNCGRRWQWWLNCT